METLIIRADASAAIGHGHVMRCLALAQSWQDRGGRCVFISSHPMGALENRLKSEGFEAVNVDAIAGSRPDAEQLLQFAVQNDARWVVVDGYHFGVEYHQIIKTAGFKLLVVDDYGQIGVYAADIILDQNAGTHENPYAHCEPGTDLLLGTRYAMVRREFRTWRGDKREIPAIAHKMLVTMGGSDPENLSVRIVEALQGSNLEEITLVVGSGSPQLKQFDALTANSKDKIRVLVNVPTMPELMAKADMAIIAGGGTLWELLYMGCPVLSFSRNAQQYDILSALHSQDVVEFIGRAEDLNPDDLVSAVNGLASSRERRRGMSSLGRMAVDGLGADRVCEALINDNSIGNQFEYRAGVTARS